MYTDKFLAFIDILGFKSLVARSETGELPFPDLLLILSKLGRLKDKSSFDKYGPSLCPASQRLSDNLDLEITQISDCVVKSCEISPCGVINLIGLCWSSVTELMTLGIMCRGYITRGNIYHNVSQFIGVGYQKALEMEARVSAFKTDAEEIGTPFVEVDVEVVNYVESSGDECAIKLFNRMIKKDGGLVVIWPFNVLSHSFVLAGGKGFDAMKEKLRNNKVRCHIKSLKDKINSHAGENQNALKKSRHYLKMLDDQLLACDETDRVIDMLSWPFPGPGTFSDF